jgi:retron-type reverse transcriptase
MGKDLTEVRSPQRKLVPDKVGLEQYEQTSLRGIATKAKARAKHRFQDLYRLLNAQFLMNCWKDLNKDAASGVDKVTAEAYQENLEANIHNLEKRLKDKRYRAKLVRRCYIPKDKGKAAGYPSSGRPAAATGLRQGLGIDLRSGLCRYQLWVQTQSKR